MLSVLQLIFRLIDFSIGKLWLFGNVDLISRSSAAHIRNAHLYNIIIQP
jgi:hypothetical protein